MQQIADQANSSNSTCPAGPADGVGPLERQRSALRDLVALASECARREAEINEEFTTQRDTARERYNASMKEIEARFKARTDELENKIHEEMDGIEQQYRRKLQTFQAAHQQTCAGIQWDYSAAEKTARSSYDEAKLLIETGLDASHNRALQEKETLKEEVASHLEAVENLFKETAQVMARYSLVPPGIEPEKVKPRLPADLSVKKVMAEELEQARSRLAALAKLPLPKFMSGILPIMIGLALCSVAGIAAQMIKGGSVPHIKTITIAVGVAVVIEVIIYILLRRAAKKQFSAASLPIIEALASSHAASELFSQAQLVEIQAANDAARRKGQAELDRLKQRTIQTIKSLQEKRSARLAAAEADRARSTGEADAEKASLMAAQATSADARRNELKHNYETEMEAARRTFEGSNAANEERTRQAWSELDQRLRTGLAQIAAPTVDTGTSGGYAPDGRPIWDHWHAPEKFPELMPFGRLSVNLKQIVDQDSAGAQVKLQFPAEFTVPASLAFPHGASLAVLHQRSGRGLAVEFLRVVILRLLTCLPPGRARFTLIDPVGLGQSFAGFMRLADYDDALVNGRIWTQPDQIEQRLSHMTEHMETVIQKYLRNEFPTIDDYNAQAGELAEPYRFLVVADFPSGFGPDALRRLDAIAATGARCGVYVLLSSEREQSGDAAVTLDKLLSHCVVLTQAEGGFQWRDDIFGKFPLTLDTSPTETVMTTLLDQVGKAAKASQHVEVSFETIAPKESQWWTGNSTADLTVAIGRMGATRLQMLRLGKNVAQHALLAGKTGSGKSTLLHVLVTNLAMWYSPDEVELYLIDFKKGVEFKTYAAHRLPHARAIAVESDREFGLSVLERLDAELARRGELFRAAGVQDLPSYRRTTGKPMPRTILVIDEFQEFFTEDDTLAQQAGLLLDRLVRQGRAFGVHLLLGSQTVGGTSGLARSTLGQMAVRIALQVSDADSQLILGDNNSAAKLLSRPGAAIYNDAGGLIEANSPFQVAWLSDEKRDEFLEAVSRRAARVAHDGKTAWQSKPPVVFEGNAPADVHNNEPLKKLLVSLPPAAIPLEPHAWTGEPVAIKEPAFVTFRRQSGANVMLVGQQEEQALAVLSWMLISLAAQFPTNGAKFYLLDGTPAGSPLSGIFPQLPSLMRGDVQVPAWRDIESAIAAIAAELSQRQKDRRPDAPAIFLVIYGMQRFRMLRKSDSDFGFSLGGADEEKKADPAKDFQEIIREGPALGIHVLTWVDTMASIERTFDRAMLREFDQRILFQMSAADSSTLIDSVAANRLGFYRALLCSEERGTIEKFRPYGLPKAAELQQLRSADAATSA
ncbi:MAG: FtsK/SpoIIIE domain-containing protein [Phycisphaerae bacterium]